jgi:hypothetical protein
MPKGPLDVPFAEIDVEPFNDKGDWVGPDEFGSSEDWEDGIIGGCWAETKRAAPMRDAMDMTRITKSVNAIFPLNAHPNLNLFRLTSIDY